MTTQPKHRPHARVDAEGYVYDIRPRSGSWLILPLTALAFLVLGVVLATRAWPDTPQAGIAPLPTAGLAPRPTYLPAPTPDAGVLPYNATQEARATAYQATDIAAVVTPAASTPTSDPAQFWTADERAAFTATAIAWYDPATVPTAPAAFIDATLAGCADAELVAESPMLQLWCPKEEK